MYKFVPVETDDLVMFDDGEVEGFMAFEFTSVDNISGEYSVVFMPSLSGHVSLTNPEGDQIHGPVPLDLTRATMDALNTLLEDMFDCMVSEDNHDDFYAYVEEWADR